jgi:hypothetical protein
LETDEEIDANTDEPGWARYCKQERDKGAQIICNYCAWCRRRRLTTVKHKYQIERV